jgi:rhamnosyl/mannosyltransferase
MIKERHPGPVVLFLGRVAYYKGLDVLVRSMQGIEATCLIVGNGPLRGSLGQLVNELHLTQKIVFVGEVPDEERAAYYHAADLFVLASTSRAESFGIAMLESMACGTPAVSTELGTGTSWVNQHDETGLVVPPNDPTALSTAIRALLEDEGRRRQMGYAAAARAGEIFTRDKMLSLLQDVYRSF